MYNLNKALIIIFFSASSVFGLLSCLKGDFDAPPSGFVEIPADQIVTLNSIVSLIAANPLKLDLDKYLEVVVVGGDKSGNFYKNLIVEDLNGDLGISVIIDETDLFSKYPVGQGIYIHLKDLYIGLTEGLPTLGTGPEASSNGRVARIPAGLVKTILLQGKSNIEVKPRKVSFAQLNQSMYNTLIELENFEFRSATPTTTYADNSNPASPFSVNHTLVNCAKNEIVLRNSGFADFAGDIVPSGNGNIVAVYSYFRNAAQLFIRDVSDINFSGERCGQVGSGTRVTITDLRTAFNSGTTTAPAAFIQGVVISDAVAGNLVAQNLVLQDGQSGLTLRFSSAHNIALGKEIKVNIGGLTLSEFNGLLQLATIPNENITVIGDGVMPTPIELTVSQAANKIYESTLIKIKDVELSGGATFGSNGGNVTAKDATGTITLFTRTAANFASQALPSSKVTLTVIASRFNTPQIQLRNASDIVGGGGTVDPPTTGVNENFNSLADNQDITLPGWLNVAVVGTSKWVKKSFLGDGFAEARSFQDTNPQRESWLITPEVNAVSYPTLSFESEMAFFVHQGLTVWATDNYSGSPSTTTWVQLNPKIANNSNANYERVSSGNLDIKAFGAKARVGFKYVGTSAMNTTTYRIDNVVIK